jgi:hypothetical protein
MRSIAFETRQPWWWVRANIDEATWKVINASGIEDFGKFEMLSSTESCNGVI